MSFVLVCFVCLFALVLLFPCFLKFCLKPSGQSSSVAVDGICGFSIYGGAQNGWFIAEHPKLNWMMTRGTINILGHLQIAICKFVWQGSTSAWLHIYQLKSTDDSSLAYLRGSTSEDPWKKCLDGCMLMCAGKTIALVICFFPDA